MDRSHANAEPHEVKEIAADHIPRGMKAAAIGNLDHRRVRIGMRVRRVRVGRIDADVVTGKTAATPV